jgi:hypothetical protein
VIEIYNNKFDKEYSTQWKEEVLFLKSQGIRYTFVKNINGIDNYKFTKTLGLFKALMLFYDQN